jgi:hypothetical protein
MRRFREKRRAYPSRRLVYSKAKVVYKVFFPGVLALLQRILQVLSLQDNIVLHEFIHERKLKFLLNLLESVLCGLLPVNETNDKVAVSVE